MKSFKTFISEATKVSQKFTLTSADAIKFAPTKLKTDIKALFTLFKDKDLIFADSNWNKTTRAQWSIKTSKANVDAAKAGLEGTASTKGFKFKTTDGYTINLLASGKTGSVKAADAKTTRMQELGSAWIIRRAINDNVKYTKWQDIPKDPKFSELVELYPDVVNDTLWLQGYYAQQKKMLDEFSNTSFTEYNREGGFMDFITKLVKTKFGITHKDTWNPADIWLIKNEAAVEREIKKQLDGSKASQTIAELNALLRQLFKERRVVGISLKKISGKVARYEEFNVDDANLGSDYNYEIKKNLINLNVNEKGIFGTQDARIWVGDKNALYNFQIKGNDTKGFANLKYEPTAQGAGAARVGKAPVSMVAALLKDNGINFTNNNNAYPKTAEEFIKRKDEFVSTFNSLKKNVDTAGVTDAKVFADNMVRAFAGPKPWIANVKLMQMDWLNNVYKLPKTKRLEFATDLIWIAAKKGEQFGPFGKLY